MEPTPRLRCFYCPKCDDVGGMSLCARCMSPCVYVEVERKPRVPLLLLLALLGLLLAVGSLYLLQGGSSIEWDNASCCLMCGAGGLVLVILLVVGWKVLFYRYRDDLDRAREVGREKARGLRAKADESIVETDASVLVVCQKCRKGYPEDRRRCPHCGTPQRKSRPGSGKAG